jgi:hypothetical protein
MTYLFFDIFGIYMLWGIQDQLRVFLRALLGQQVPQHDVCIVHAVVVCIAVHFCKI